MQTWVPLFRFPIAFLPDSDPCSQDRSELYSFSSRALDDFIRGLPSLLIQVILLNHLRQLSTFRLEVERCS